MHFTTTEYHQRPSSSSDDSFTNCLFVFQRSFLLKWCCNFYSMFGHPEKVLIARFFLLWTHNSISGDWLEKQVENDTVLDAILSLVSRDAALRTACIPHLALLATRRSSCKYGITTASRLTPETFLCLLAGLIPMWTRHSTIHVGWLPVEQMPVNLGALGNH